MTVAVIIGVSERKAKNATPAESKESL
jgi:hypothetical protein